MMKRPRLHPPHHPAPPPPIQQQRNPPGGLGFTPGNFASKHPSGQHQPFNREPQSRYPDPGSGRQSNGPGRGSTRGSGRGRGRGPPRGRGRGRGQVRGRGGGRGGRHGTGFDPGRGAAHSTGPPGYSHGPDLAGSQLAHTEPHFDGQREQREGAGVAQQTVVVASKFPLLGEPRQSTLFVFACSLLFYVNESATLDSAGNSFVWADMNLLIDRMTPAQRVKIQEQGGGVQAVQELPRDFLSLRDDEGSVQVGLRLKTAIILRDHLLALGKGSANLPQTPSQCPGVDDLSKQILESLEHARENARGKHCFQVLASLVTMVKSSWDDFHSWKGNGKGGKGKAKQQKVSQLFSKLSVVYNRVVSQECHSNSGAHPAFVLFVYKNAVGFAREVSQALTGKDGKGHGNLVDGKEACLYKAMGLLQAPCWVILPPSALEELDNALHGLQNLEHQIRASSDGKTLASLDKARNAWGGRGSDASQLKPADRRPSQPPLLGARSSPVPPMPEGLRPDIGYPGMAQAQPPPPFGFSGQPLAVKPPKPPPMLDDDVGMASSSSASLHLEPQWGSGPSAPPPAPHFASVPLFQDEQQPHQQQVPPPPFLEQLEQPPPQLLASNPPVNDAHQVHHLNDPRQRRGRHQADHDLEHQHQQQLQRKHDRDAADAGQGSPSRKRPRVAADTHEGGAGGVVVGVGVDGSASGTSTSGPKGVLKGSGSKSSGRRIRFGELPRDDQGREIGQVLDWEGKHDFQYMSSKYNIKCMQCGKLSERVCQRCVYCKKCFHAGQTPGPRDQCGGKKKVQKAPEWSPTKNKEEKVEGPKGPGTQKALNRRLCRAIWLAPKYGGNELQGCDAMIALIRAGADCSFQREAGESSLHIAVFLADVKAVAQLLEWSADLTLLDSDKATPLDVAEKRLRETRTPETAEKLRRIVKLLKDAEKR
ncbi:unnamed protein product [Chrysoparadoxa australica]